MTAGLRTGDTMKPQTIAAFVEHEITFPTTEATLADMRKWAAGEAAKWNDGQGYDLIAAALTTVRTTRTAIEARRKELKAGALEYGRKIDATAKRLTGLIVDIEEPLRQLKQSEDDRIEQEKRSIDEQLLDNERQRLADLAADLDRREAAIAQREPAIAPAIKRAETSVDKPQRGYWIGVCILVARANVADQTVADNAQRELEGLLQS